MSKTTNRLVASSRLKISLLFIDWAPLILWFQLRRTRREPSIIILDHLSIAIGSVAIPKRAGAVVAKLSLEPPRELNLQLTQRVDHLALEQGELCRVGERIWIDASQLLDCAIEVFCKIAVAPQRAFQFFGVGQPLAKLAFELALSTARRSSAH